MSDRNEWGITQRGHRKTNDSPCVIDAGFNGASLRSYNWVFKYMAYLREIYRPAQLKKTTGRNMEFVPGNQESIDSAHSTIIHIFFENKFRALRALLIFVESELLAGVDVINKLRITVDSGNRNLHVGHGGWKVVARNPKNRLLFPLPPTARGYTKLGGCCAKMGNCYLAGLAFQADF